MLNTDGNNKNEQSIVSEISNEFLIFLEKISLGSYFWWINQFACAIYVSVYICCRHRHHPRCSSILCCFDYICIRRNWAMQKPCTPHSKCHQSFPFNFRWQSKQFLINHTVNISIHCGMQCVEYYSSACVFFMLLEEYSRYSLFNELYRLTLVLHRIRFIANNNKIIIK